MNISELSDKLPESGIAALLTSENSDFWKELSLVPPMLPGDVKDRDNFERTDYAGEFRITTKKHNHLAQDRVGGGRFGYWIEEATYSIEIYNESSPKGAPSLTSPLVASRKVSTLTEAMQLHLSALNHLKRNN